jgi:hypothetical protein
MTTIAITEPVETSAHPTIREALLVCGIVSSLLYAAMNVFVPLLWPDYSTAAQTVSELSAIGAPTRLLWVGLGVLYTLLVNAFAWGVFLSAGRNRALRVAGATLIAYGVVCLLWPFAPMHLRGVPPTLTDALHVGLAAVTVLLMLLAIALGAAAFGRRFRRYSIASLIVLGVFGALTFRDAPRMAAGQATPWIGVWERINIGVFLLWVMVLAVVLLRGARTPARQRRNR